MSFQVSWTVEPPLTIWTFVLGSIVTLTVVFVVMETTSGEGHILTTLNVTGNSELAVFLHTILYGGGVLTNFRTFGATIFLSGMTTNMEPARFVVGKGKVTDGTLKWTC